MFNRLKAAISKEPSSDGPDGNLGDQPGSGTERDFRYAPNLDTEDIGLVIRDLDKEREEQARNQATSRQNDDAYNQAGNSGLDANGNPDQ